MGTSVNQKSPRTTNWSGVQVGYSSQTVPIPRLAQELWRAATNQPVGNLAVDLAAPVVSTCLQVALSAQSRREAATTVIERVAQSRQGSLAADIAQRAAIKCAGEMGDRAMNFAKALFGEASNYLVARDLPGFVGPSGRAQNISEAVQLKAAVRNDVEMVVSKGPAPPTNADSAAWMHYVQSIVSQLKSRRGS